MSKISEIAKLVEDGKTKKIEAAVQAGIDEGDAAPAILDAMIDAMGVVGEQFKNNEIFVPEMLMAAQTMKKGVAVIQPLLAGEASTKLGTCIIGTIAGDLHDIGKNLVSLMIESAGFDVVDLGVDVPPEKFIEAINANADAKIVALSCLLTTTMPALTNTVKALTDAGMKDKIKILVGGAPIDQKYADEVGADGTAADAASAAEMAKAMVA